MAVLGSHVGAYRASGLCLDGGTLSVDKPAFFFIASAPKAPLPMGTSFLLLDVGQRSSDPALTVAIKLTDRESTHECEHDQSRLPLLRCLSL